jgi:hypothetical protein
MSEWFKLIDDKFSEIHQERQWTYSCLFPFTFKKRTITEITITDHPWKKKGRKMITRELILNLLKEKIHGRKRMKPRTKHGIRDIYVRERILCQNKKYRLIFWFKDGTTNHLWIKNCHQQD